MKTCLVALWLLMAFVVFAAAEEAKFTVRVHDEVGVVITNARVRVGVTVPIKPGWGWGGGKEEIWDGATDANGLCVVQLKCYGEAGLSVTKEGYYGSSGYKVMFTNLVSGKWEPWNPEIDVVLRPKVLPIPMYTKQVHDVKVPIFGQAVGFDLLRGDWVAPYGNGEVPDFRFTLISKPEQTITTRNGPLRLFDFTLSMGFSKDGDGIIPLPLIRRRGGSTLRMDRQAPETGYQTNVVKRIYQEASQPPRSDVHEGQNYFFRVRTKKDDKGDVVSALYGKIHGDFCGFDYGKLTFTYYLNPTPNDRNVEFDPTKNLFENLSSLEQVRAP